jgi:DNA-directed RNA polymerase II subunit RPB7
MGFFNIELERNILLHPAHFGPRMREILYERLRGEVRAQPRGTHTRSRALALSSASALRIAQVEGTCSGRYGFVVLVTNIKNVGEARTHARAHARRAFAPHPHAPRRRRSTARLPAQRRARAAASARCVVQR